MRNRVKSYFIIILVAIFGACLFSGCGDISTSDSYFETEYFKCCYDDNGEVIIGGLTLKGRKLDTIIIPSEINGRKVSIIGYRYGNSNSFATI